MTRTHVQEVRAEKVFAFAIRHVHLGHGDEFFVFTDIIGEAFVTHRVDFSRNDKCIGPNFN